MLDHLEAQKAAALEFMHALVYRQDERVTDLNFGTIVMGNLTSAERVTVLAAGGIGCGSSGALVCTGPVQAASYRVTGTQGQVVTVSSPTATSLSGPGGASLAFTPLFPATVSLTNSGATGNLFSVGGYVDIDADTVDGVYTGEIDIRVAYQ